MFFGNGNQFRALLNCVKRAKVNFIELGCFDVLYKPKRSAPGNLTIVLVVNKQKGGAIDRGDMQLLLSLKIANQKKQLT